MPFCVGDALSGGPVRVGLGGGHAKGTNRHAVGGVTQFWVLAEVADQVALLMPAMSRRYCFQYSSTMPVWRNNSSQTLVTALALDGSQTQPRTSQGHLVLRHTLGDCARPAYQRWNVASMRLCVRMCFTGSPTRPRSGEVVGRSGLGEHPHVGPNALFSPLNDHNLRAPGDDIPMQRPGLRFFFGCFTGSTPHNSGLLAEWQVLAKGHRTHSGFGLHTRAPISMTAWL